MDLLADVAWECAPAPAGLLASPAALDSAALDWTPAAVPGTAAGAWRDAGRAEPSAEDLDGADWWFRGRFTGPPDAGRQRWFLELDGVATVWDAWVDGTHLGGGDSMFAATRLAAAVGPGPGEVVLRCAALDLLLAERRPRPRWKSALPRHPNLRWFRTTLLGRQVGWVPTPPPVGPWRPVRLVAADPTAVVGRRLTASCGAVPPSAGADPGEVEVVLTLDGPVEGAVVEVAGSRADLACTPDGDRWALTGRVVLDHVERWWPHGYGDQRRYPVRVHLADRVVEVGSVGFRSVAVDRDGGAFTVSVNGVPIFCRGACWFPTDPVGWSPDQSGVAAALSEAAAAGWTMVRIPGGTAYPDDSFLDHCDAVGLLVWLDLMSAQAALPEDDGPAAAVLVDETVTVAAEAAGHPCLAVLCGGEQIEEQGAMQGLGADRWRSALLEEVLPAAVAGVAPDVPWVTSSPSGGDLPFRTDTGVCHYAGVGPYLRPLTDLRLAAPRFVSEGIAFAVPPEPETVDRCFGGAAQALADPAWRQAAHRDAGAPTDLVDVTDHYVTELFGEDPSALAAHDPDRYLELARAVGVEVIEQALSEWRRPGSPCAGALAIAQRDLRPGPGWGLVDAAGRPKATWWALARTAAPLAVLCTDEGVNGLAVHLVHDGPGTVSGTVEVGLHGAAHLIEAASAPVTVPGHGATVLRADALLDGFRDLTYAYRFGPRALEVVTVVLRGPDGAVLAEAAYLPGGPARPRDPALGLQAGLERADGGAWLLSVSTDRFAQRVQVRFPGFRASDSWFHLAPGQVRQVLLRPGTAARGRPTGSVSALNATGQLTVGR